MKHFLDLKAIGYGLATFVAGRILVGQLGRSMLDSTAVSSERTAWILGMIGGITVPAIAGFVSAYNARSHRVMNGTIGVLLGIVLLAGFFAPYIREFLGWGVPFLFMVFYGLMAFLGALLGSYWRSRRSS